jgi:hypothetical protein
MQTGLIVTLLQKIKQLSNLVVKENAKLAHRWRGVTLLGFLWKNAHVRGQEYSRE